MANVLILSNTATQLKNTPFSKGFEAVAMNLSAGSLIVEGSADGATGWTTQVTCGASTSATACQQITSLPAWIRVSTAGTIFLLSGASG